MNKDYRDTMDNNMKLIEKHSKDGTVCIKGIAKELDCNQIQLARQVHAFLKANRLPLGVSLQDIELSKGYENRTDCS